MMERSLGIVWIICAFLLTVVFAASDDQYIITAILEDTLAKDCVSLRKLAGTFFSNQERPPLTVKVMYNIQIPYNENCTTKCWEICINSTAAVSAGCPEGYCCLRKHYIWGRSPALVHDEIYRTLELCPFIIGGLKEKGIELNLTLNNRNDIDCPDMDIACVDNKMKFPCNWCEEKGYTSKMFTFAADDNTYILDYVLIAKEQNSPINLALKTLTAKVSICS